MRNNVKQRLRFQLFEKMIKEGEKMDKIKAFIEFLNSSTVRQHRLANANLDMCYSNYEMENLLLMLKEKQEMAQKAGILSTDFYDGYFKVQVTYEYFQQLTEGVKEIRSEPSMFPQFGYEHLFAEVDGVHLLAVRKVDNKKCKRNSTCIMLEL